MSDLEASYITYLVIQRAFPKQKSVTTFLTAKRGSQGHCPWSLVSVAAPGQ